MDKSAAHVNCSSSFRKYAETYLVERGIFQSFKSLCDKVIALQIPYITGCADRIIRCSVGILK